MEVTVTTKVTAVKKYLESCKGYMICDIETSSLTPENGHIICIGFGADNRDDVLVYFPKDLEHLKQLKLNKGVFHNAPFDLRWLHSYGMEAECKWDTLMMAHLLNENQNRKGLKDLGQQLLGYPDWTMGEIDNLENVPKDEVAEYVAKDIHVTRELRHWQRDYIKRNSKPGERPVHVMKTVMIPAIEPLTQMEINRMPLRLKELAKVREQVELKLASINQQLDRMVPPKEEWPDFLQKSTVNWGNTNWTRWWLYVYEGAMCPARGKPTKHFPEGNPSLSQTTLAKIDHPAAKLLSERSTVNKLLTGFLIPLEERGASGRVPTSFKLHGTVTGRLSSSTPSKETPGINSQQIPRDNSIRNLFGEKGQAWIEADYSQLELRVAAVLAKEKTMLELFASGTDIHTYMAERLVRGGEVTKSHRTLAKGVNFGFLYGMRDTHFANYVQESYGVIISRAEATAFREEYFTTFSGLEPWYRRQREFAIKHGGVPNAFGRFRHLPKVYDENYWVQEEAFRQAINSPVQSTGSDFMLISLARLAGDLRLKQLGAKLITTVHDSVCLTAPYKSAREVAKIVKRTMEKADDRLEEKFFITADVTISRYWGGEALAEY